MNQARYKSSKAPSLALALMLSAIFFLPLMGNAQAVRWDQPIYTLNISAPLNSAMYPVLGLYGSSAKICATWTNGVAACNSLATTYTSSTAGTPCPSNAQLTSNTGGSCTNVTDTSAYVGAWLIPGTYAYVVTTSYGTFGPYQFSVDAGGAYCAMAGCTMTGAFVAPALNAIEYANQFSGADIGAQINAAYAALPVTGGQIDVSLPAAGLSFSTPIVIGTLAKPAIINCRANTGSPGSSTPPALTFTGTSGSALTFNYAGAGGTHPRGAGTRNCTFYGSGGTSVGLTLGGTQGAEGFEDDDSSWANFGTDVVFGSNTWQTYFNHSALSGPGVLLSIPSALTNAGEHLSFNNVSFLQNSVSNMANSVAVAGAGTQWTCVSCSFDNAQLVIGSNLALGELVYPHFENPGAAISIPNLIVNGGNLNMIGPQFFNDFAGTTAPAFVSLTAGNTSVYGMDSASVTYVYPTLFAISGSASLYEMFPTTSNGSNNVFITGTTTGRYVVDTGSNCSGACQSILTNTPYVVNSSSLQVDNDQFNRFGLFADSLASNTLQNRAFMTNDFSGFATAKVQSAISSACAGKSYSSKIVLYTEQKSAANSTDTSTPVATFDCDGTFNSLLVSNASGWTKMQSAANGFQFTYDGTHTIFISSALANFNVVPLSANGFQYNGTAGITATKTAGSCVLTIQGGIITNVTGC